MKRPNNSTFIKDKKKKGKINREKELTSSFAPAAIFMKDESFNLKEILYLLLSGGTYNYSNFGRNDYLTPKAYIGTGVLLSFSQER